MLALFVGGNDNDDDDRVCEKNYARGSGHEDDPHAHSSAERRRQKLDNVTWAIPGGDTRW